MAVNWPGRVVKLAAVVSLVAFVLIRSRGGLGLLAVREDEEAARASGVSALRHKLAALGLSSFFGLLFIVVVLALPGGLMDIWSRRRQRAQVERKAQAGV